MKKRMLGQQGLEVSAIGLGCASMSEGLYGTPDDVQSHDTLRRAVDLGVTLFDTAEVYGFGHNEQLVGEALRDVRDRVVIASKFGVTMSPQGVPGVCGRPDFVHESCESSLKRLGTDRIDLYYLHRLDPEVPIEETVGAMADLVKEGKVRALGLSEVSPRTVRRAHAVYPISAVQTEYSLWSREPEEDVLTVCRKLGIGFVAYSPLGRGFLTGAIRSKDNLDKSDYRQINPRFSDENIKRNLALLREFEEIAREKRCTPGQLALAWVLAQRDDIVPIPGTKRISYLEENAAAEAVSLSPGELSRISAMFPLGAAAGDRYGEMEMAFVDQ